MTFSSHIIAATAPPASAPVRNLGLLLWTLPILISAFTLVISPRGSAPAEREMVKDDVRPRAFAAAIELPDLVEPDAFARVGGPYYGAPLPSLAPGDEPRFPLLAEAWKPTSFTAGKIELKVDNMRLASPAPTSMRRGADIAAADISKAVRAGAAPEGAMRELRRVRAIGATALHADDISIVLAGVEPLPETAACRRLDGVMQSCIERAQHRLAVLLQARAITCQLSKRLDNGLFAGRCLADKIDLAADLLRHKLVQRPSSTLAVNTP